MIAKLSRKKNRNNGMRYDTSYSSFIPVLCVIVHGTLCGCSWGERCNIAHSRCDRAGEECAESRQILAARRDYLAYWQRSIRLYSSVSPLAHKPSPTTDAPPPHERAPVAFQRLVRWAGKKKTRGKMKQTPTTAIVTSTVTEQKAKENQLTRPRQESNLESLERVNEPKSSALAIRPRGQLI